MAFSREVVEQKFDIKSPPELSIGIAAIDESAYELDDFKEGLNWQDLKAERLYLGAFMAADKRMYEEKNSKKQKI
jgi:hypothetical protein